MMPAGRAVSASCADDSGTIYLRRRDGRELDITNFSSSEAHRFRGREMSVIIQEFMTSLNSVFII
jgi:ABC-type dipeptide/oligopeptide/nickel transport system ATPase component